jgi:1-aminocyclopropane-1-carboxylate deaminase/D-cysteine desulfhydrase-like pyridoxal-dependent ACC family enzyme
MTSFPWIARDLAAGHPRLRALTGLMDGRQRLAVLPTPLHPAPRFSAALGQEVWLKRDDLTATGLGGNKIRKLELIAADALAEGGDVLVSAGAPQSNHARTVATVAAMLGLGCHLVLGGDQPVRATGNLLLDELMGAHLHWTGSNGWAALAAGVDRVTGDLRAEGRHPYPIPVGGSVPLGSASFVAAYLELAVQCRDAGLSPIAVIHASSSAGTQAGLSLGHALATVLGADLGVPAPPVWGVDVAKITDPLAGEVTRLAAETADLLGVGDLWTEAGGPVRVLDRYLGPGYAVASSGATEALRLLARTEGVVTDPVYSAKGLHAVCAERVDGPVVFWHTGGVPALFSDETGPDSWPV